MAERFYLRDIFLGGKAGGPSTPRIRHGWLRGTDVLRATVERNVLSLDATATVGRMKWFFLLMPLMLSSCTVTASLYPVKGEFAKQSPLPVLKAKVHGVTGNAGDVELTMPSGEQLRGRWSSLAPQQVTASKFSGNVALNQGITSAYGTVYGSGVSVSNVPGVNKGTAFLTGSQGTNMEVEFWTGSGTASGNGVAIDNRGNVYKVIF